MSLSECHSCVYFDRLSTSAGIYNRLKSLDSDFLRNDERGGAFVPPADIQIHLSYHRTGRLLQLQTHHPLPPFSAAEEVID